MQPATQTFKNGSSASFEEQHYDRLSLSDEGSVEEMDILQTQSHKITTFLEQQETIEAETEEAPKLKRKFSPLGGAEQIEPIQKKSKPYVEGKFEGNLKKLYDLEETWKRYRSDFALKHLQVTDSSKFGEINWEKFKKTFVDYLEASLECCQKYIESYKKKEKNTECVTISQTVEHKRYALEGAIKFIAGDFALAKDLFKAAIRVDRRFFAPWLSLASVCYRMGEYKEVMQVAEDYGKLLKPYDLSSSCETVSDGGNSCEGSSEIETENKCEVLPEANELLEFPLNRLPGDICKDEFSFYANFSLLGDDCIEENCLNLMHSFYPPTEMYYYQVKAESALSKDDTKGLAKVYNLRGVECTRMGLHHQAVFNFEKAEELKGIYLDYHFAESLFTIGRVNDAIENIQKVIKHKECGNEEKCECVIKLVKYYLSLDQIPEAEFWIDRLSKMKVPYNNNILFLLMGLYYVTAKKKASLNRPAFFILKEVSGKFFNCFIMLDPFLHNDQSYDLLSRYIQLLDNLCEDWLKHGKIESIIEAHNFLLVRFKKLIHFMDPLIREPSPILKYVQLYLAFFSMTISSYFGLIAYRIDISQLSSNVAESYSLLLEKYSVVTEKIKIKQAKFESIFSSEVSFEKTLELENLDEVEAIADSPMLFEGNDKTIFQAVQMLKGEIHLLELLKNEGEHKHEDFDFGEFTQTLRAEIDQVDTLPNIEETEQIYIHLKKDPCFLVDNNILFINMLTMLRLQDRFRLIQLLTREANEKSNIGMSKEFLDIFAEIISRTQEAVHILGIYQQILEKETHSVLKMSQLKSLEKYLFNPSTYIAKFLLNYWESLKNAGCDQYALEAIGYAKALLAPLKTRDSNVDLTLSQRNGLKILFDDSENALEKVDTIKNQRFLSEALEGCSHHPLDLVYGNPDRPYTVRFPLLQIISSLWQVKQDNHICDGKNLSAHIITIVYGLPKTKGKKRAKKTLHFACNPPGAFFTKDRLEKKQNDPLHSFFSRFQKGRTIHKSITDDFKQQIGLFSVNASHPDSEFLKTKLTSKEDKNLANYRLSHSEQTFFEWSKEELAPNLLDRLKELDPCLKDTGCKVYMVAFDMGSSFDSCINCRLAALTVQSGKQNSGDFLAKFQDILSTEGYALPKKKDGIELRGVTRIFAETQRTCSLPDKHVNPKVKNVKYLQNIGLFQEVRPEVFCSGTTGSVKK